VRMRMGYSAGLTDSGWKNGDRAWRGGNKDNGQGDVIKVGFSRAFEDTKNPLTICVPNWAPVQAKFVCFV
jgi:hypothetical protein